MSLPYFPLYPTDFDGKTAHLTLLEDGAYNRLLRLCWKTPGCRIPADEAWIMRQMRARSPEEQEAVRTILDEFFTVRGGFYTNKKLSEIYVASSDAHERRKNAGSKGGKAKALKTNKSEPSNAVAKPKQPEPEPEIEANASISRARKRATRLSEDWVLPQQWGLWAVNEGWSEPTIRREADKFRDYWIAAPGQKGRKLDWFATWRNWLRNVPKQEKDNGNRHSPRRSDPHGTLFAGFGAAAFGDDGGSAEPSSSLRDVTPPGDEAMADGSGGNASQPFLRIAHVGTRG